jgi:hypothetical protein
MAVDPLTAALETGKTLIDKFWPDAGEAEKLKAQTFLATFMASADIIKTEAASQHWLAANWRPLMMLTFTGLIVARWFGWAAPNLSEAEYIKLWGIVELGIGGYTIGRSVEKIIPSIAGAIKK